MANIRILGRNAALFAAMTDSPAMLTSLPVTNLQRDTERGRTARTTGLASQDVKLVFPSNEQVNAVAVTRHNWSTASTLRSLLYSDAAWSSNISDTGALAGFSTTGINTQITDITSADFRGKKTTVQYFAEQTTVRSAIARIADAANPDGYIEQTHLFIGKFFEFTYSPPEGSVDLTLGDSSSGSRAHDGTHQVNKGYRARSLRIVLDFVHDADIDDLLAIVDYLGLTGECFVDLYPEVAGAKGLYNRMACRIVDSPSFNLNQYGNNKNTLAFEET